MTAHVGATQQVVTLLTAHRDVDNQTFDRVLDEITDFRPVVRALTELLLVVVDHFDKETGSDLLADTALSIALLDGGHE